ncbi:MAG TPA: hypothetical protein VMD03_10235 [Steroidobacteraceae bacterium]|nr:hypothetical protein [Steroidobacteraceae bacterium]
MNNTSAVDVSIQAISPLLGVGAEAGAGAAPTAEPVVVAGAVAAGADAGGDAGVAATGVDAEAPAADDWACARPAPRQKT